MSSLDLHSSWSATPGISSPQNSQSMAIDPFLWQLVHAHEALVSNWYPTRPSQYPTTGHLKGGIFNHEVSCRSSDGRRQPEQTMAMILDLGMVNEQDGFVYQPDSFMFMNQNIELYLINLDGQE